MQQQQSHQVTGVNSVALLCVMVSQITQHELTADRKTAIQHVTLKHNHVLLVFALDFSQHEQMF